MSNFQLDCWIPGVVLKLGKVGVNAYSGDHLGLSACIKTNLEFVGGSGVAMHIYYKAYFESG